MEESFESSLREKNSSLFNKLLIEYLQNEEYNIATTARAESFLLCRITVYGFNIWAAKDD
jgi:hypothetical protein